MKNSIEALKRPMALWKLRLEFLNCSLALLNLAASAFSLENALAVRMPDRLDSMSALMPAMVCLTTREAERMAVRLTMHTTIKMGIKIITTSANCQRMVNMTAIAPITVTKEIKRSSGPWWASSVMSNSSAVIRLIRWPVRFLS